TAAGSPGLRCSKANTNSATTSITGMVARIRRRRYAYIRLLQSSVPEEGHGRGNHPLEVFAVGSNREILSRNDVRHALIGCQLDLGGQPFLLRGIRGPRPRPSQGFESLIARPTKPRFVRTPTRHPYVDERIEGIGSNP